MLNDMDFNANISKEDYDLLMKELTPRLSALQQRLIAARLPVAVVVEGLGASGKGAAISSLILNFDPRGFSVFSMRAPTQTEARFPWLARFAKRMPARGRLSVFDRSWYSGMLDVVKKPKKHEDFDGCIDDINVYERQFVDDGGLLIKFFLNISEKEQRKRLERLAGNKDTAWRVTERDLQNLKHYKRNQGYFRYTLEKTNTAGAPWHIIDATDRRYVRVQMATIIARQVENALKAMETHDETALPIIGSRFETVLLPNIETMNLDKEMDDDTYETELKALQKRLGELQNLLYLKRIPMIICYEGNDAAGKGGNIKRVARALDSRGYGVTPIAAPTQAELAHQYLWRFWNALPRSGHTEIFDRTWYGRVLVERVEHLTPAHRIAQAYEEINEFEYMLHEWGAIILKFWLVVSKDEQLRRFEDRQNTPEKQWKITDEDWRNREKWDDYAKAVREMFLYTNTEFAPWEIIESNNKKYARVKTLRIIVDAATQRLKQ